ncbi:general substrate transporter [Phlegmacium glaucopus]|nr:general substrate transporter [Phlegmacium glaucopus]
MTYTPQWSIVDSLYKGFWWNNRGILMLNICLLIPMLTSVVNGIDSSILNGLQLLPDWQNYFGHPRGSTLGILSSAQFLGNLTALPMTPFASDVYGRRVALLFGSVIMLIGVGLQAVAWNLPMFIGARYCIGFGLSFCQNAAPLLLIELSYPTQRGKITAMFNSCGYLGSVISAWVCYGAYVRANGTTWSWRLPTIVQALIPVIQIASLWFVPESPRWLVATGKENKAAAILAKYHANGSDGHHPLVMFEIAQIRRAIDKEEEINKSTSYWSLFSTPGNRKRMRIILAIGVFSQWSGNGLVSYYLNLVLDSVGITKTETKAVVNGYLQIFNLFVALGASMLVDFVGRRPLFLISNSGMLASNVVFSCWTATTALYHTTSNVSAAKATIPLIFLFFVFYDLAYTPMLVAYTLEILPLRVRAKGFAAMNLVATVTVAFNQFVNPWALASSFGWRYYIVYCVWLVIELLFVIFFIVETKGSTLEETASLFDGQDQTLDLITTGSEAATRSVAGPIFISLPSIHSLSIDEEYYEMKKRYGL